MPQNYLQKPLWRMVHFDNLEHLLRNGMCSRASAHSDPDYINIGDSSLIQQRNTYPVPILPSGNLGDYVPFYFGGHSPMLYKIKTGHGGITQREQSKVVFIVCTVKKILDHCPEWCFTDGHAKTRITAFYNQSQDLDKVDWVAVDAQYWRNTEDDQDRQRKKQAEFLVKNFVPVECIVGLVVYNDQTKVQLECMVRRLGLSIPVEVDNKKKLYY